MSAKPARSLEQQCTLLRERGLIISDEAAAHAFLHDTNYYRLAGFGRQFQRDPARGDNSYETGTTFDLLVEMCTTDIELSLHLTRALGLIECAVRSRLALALALQHGSHAFYLEHDVYVTTPHDAAMAASTLAAKVDDLIEKIRGELCRDKGRTISRYAGADRANLAAVPIWVAIELLSFGTVSRLLELLDDKTARDSVASSFGEPKGKFTSTVHSLAVLRNRCAHHGQIWHRPLTIHTPVDGNIRRRAQVSFDSQGPYAALLAVQRLLARIHGAADASIALSNFVRSAPPLYMDGIYRPAPR